MAISVLIADDHEVVRLGLKNLLQGTECEVVAEAMTGEQALELVATKKPDLLILDVRMSGGDGLYVLGRVKLDRPELPVILLSTYDNPTYVARGWHWVLPAMFSRAIHANDYWSRSTLPCAAIRLGHATKLRRVTGALATPRLQTDVEVPLTQRESEVLKQLANGLTNKEIALALSISYETVKEHVQHILRKIGVSDRTQAAVWAVRKGLV